ncbi:MAG TPA: hypothetical protein VLF19_04570 [Methylomirabilota bacterium]|nr:hypothetical protein [Methylomirabilota bacterium]
MARPVADRCGVCGAQIRGKATVTWVDDRVVHVVCYTPGLGKKTRKPAASGTLGLRDGRLFAPSPGSTVEAEPVDSLKSRATGA